MPKLIIYNRKQVAEVLRLWTPQKLATELQMGNFGATLETHEAQELGQLLQEWLQRALAVLTLRDTLLVDPRRGERVHNFICTTTTLGCCTLSAESVQTFLPLKDIEAENLTSKQIYALLADDPSTLNLLSNLEQTDFTELGFVLSTEDKISYPFPPDLETLLPPLPKAYQGEQIQFEQPKGWRRILVIILALLGLTTFLLPLILGQLPTQPAGLPLGLLTLALLVGIRSGWLGFAGAGAIWFVANLPYFRYGSPLTLFPTLLLLFLGLFLLALDRHVRALGAWVFARRANGLSKNNV